MILVRLLARDLDVEPPTTREFLACLITAALVLGGIAATFAILPAFAS